MTLLVALFDGDQPPRLEAGTARALARLGVTDVTLADGAKGSAVVLMGWAFDGRRHEQAVVELLGPGRAARVLHAVADVALRPDTVEAGPPQNTHRSTTRRTT